MVDLLTSAKVEDHIQTIISWLVLYSAPSVNHFNWVGFEKTVLRKNYMNELKNIQLKKNQLSYITFTQTESKAAGIV